ncbi:patatin-like phospholipase family protein [Xylanibacter caecicola]|uniref:patatin-like phospholipase family protein n=1 Tax=Xylanibacter caecicola TaxID=2736294 RepID=UPI003DA4693C
MLSAFAGAAEEQHDVPRKKVAVVLSGGGAKGMAHIGALRVIERAGIPIDYIAGTSMGAIVGGLYSIGYDTKMLDSLIRAQDWKFLLSDKADIHGRSLANRQKQHTYILSKPITPALKDNVAAGGLIQGTNLSNLFTRLTTGYHDSIDFDSLPIPFACVATNIVDNTEYDFRSGNLATAMRASMSIPGAFTPVRLDTLVLVDGGLRNNYPADLAKRMGADIIIGVSVQGQARTADELYSGASILSQIIDVNCKNKYDENWSITDVPIKVDVKGYSATSFTKVAIDTLINRGESAAMEQWNELMRIKRSLGLPDDYMPVRKGTAGKSLMPSRFKLVAVEFDNVDDYDKRYIVSKYDIGTSDSVSSGQIEKAVVAMYADLMYTDAGYSLVKKGGGYVLRITAKSKKISDIDLGVRFDTEEMVALQGSISYRVRAKLPVNLAFVARLGKRIMSRIDADVMPLRFSKIGLSYIFRHNDINMYSNGSRDYNFTYNHHSVKLRLFEAEARNVQISLGAGWDYYTFHDVLTGENAGGQELGGSRFYSYHIRTHYDSEDEWLFTTRGAKFEAGYGYYTDNFADMDGHKGISIADVMWRMSFPLGGKFAIQPMLYGRLIAGGNVPMIMRNAIGGNRFANYLEQQMPFSGVGNVEFADNMFVAFRLKGQYRMTENNYFMLFFAAAQESSKFANVFEHGPVLGCNLSYYYNTMLGPLGVTAGYSDRTRKPYLYASFGFDF